MIRIDRVQVEAFQTEDGRQFKTEREAVEHASKLALHRWIVDRGICAGGHWSQDEVYDEMVEGCKELVEILEPMANLK
jgi:hypothetical protein